jgi:hypothetical protein
LANVGIVEFKSCTLAIKTGPEAKRKKPKTANIGKSRVEWKLTNRSIKTAVTTDEIRSILNLPILSEYEPENIVPKIPKNCKTDKEIPA